MDSFGTAVSMSLQYGVPLEVLVNKFSHTRFDPMGRTANPDIRQAKSVVDYIFRWLAIEFIPGYREATLGLPAKETSTSEGEPGETKPVATKAGGQTGQGADTATADASATKSLDGANGKSNHNGHSNGHANGKGESNAAQLEKAGALINVDTIAESSSTRSEQFARFQGDAPSCDNCGAITVRNGNCYLCHNCGNSMGCS